MPGYRFVSELGGEAMPPEYTDALEEGVRTLFEEACGTAVALRVVLREALVHPVDANESRFRQAGRIAALEALRRAAVPPRFRDSGPMPAEDVLRFGGDYRGLAAAPTKDRWELVTYWHSELWQDRAEHLPDRSVRAYELALRVPHSPEEVKPPASAFTLLKRLESVGRNRASPLRAGEVMDLRGRHRPDAGPAGLVFTEDPRCPSVPAPGGRADFLLAVGVTSDEMARIARSGAAGVLRELSAGDPLLITDPGLRARRS